MKKLANLTSSALLAVCLLGTSNSVPCIADSAFEGVRSVWVSASQWPNARTQETFARDAVRLYGVTHGTEEQKALALYSYALRVMGHGGDYAQGPYGREVPPWDHWMIFHSYAKAYCEHWGWFLVDLWKAYKNNWEFGPAGVAMKVGVNAKADNPLYGTHAESALRYTDTDGLDRWHLFDGERAFFARARDTNRVATPEEIHAEFPTLLTLPNNPPHPFFIGATVHGQPETDSAFHRFLGDTYPFAYSPSQRRTKYSTDFDLRVGESLKRLWYDDEKPVVAAKYKNIGVLVSVDNYQRYLYPSGQPKDPYNFKAVRQYMKAWPRQGVALSKPFGNAYGTYTPELTGERYKVGALSSSGLASGTGQVKLRAATLNVEGNVIYQIRSIYPIAASFIAGKYFIKSAGEIAIDFSLDLGATWINVMDASTVLPTPVSFNINIGRARWIQGLSSPYNVPDRDSQYNDASFPDQWNAVNFTGFQYLVRLRILAKTRVADVGLVRLAFSNTYQLNIGMLPTLLPGTNTIKVEGDLTPGAALKIEYVWSECGIRKTQTETAYSLPFEFNIYVNEPDALKVRCLYQTLTAVSR